MKSFDIFGKAGNGSLDAAILSDVSGNGKNWNENKGDRLLNVCIDFVDFENIHKETYRLTFSKNPDADLFYTTKFVKILEKISSKFPMLCRFKDMYEDAIFEVEEVKMLRDECLTLKAKSQDNSTDLVLRKLLYCCDEAIKTDLNLAFYCD